MTSSEGVLHNCENPIFREAKFRLLIPTQVQRILTLLIPGKKWSGYDKLWLECTAIFCWHKRDRMFWRRDAKISRKGSLKSVRKELHLIVHS